MINDGWWDKVNLGLFFNLVLAGDFGAELRRIFAYAKYSFLASLIGRGGARG